MSNQKLVIEYDPKTGVTNISGPLDNLALCDHMLNQAARILLRTWLNAEQNRSGGPRRVLEAVGPLPPFPME